MVKFEVGQKLWFVPNVRYMGKPRWVTIQKVGRKWLTIDTCELRVSIDTLGLELSNYGTQHRGRCYLTKDEFEEENRRNEAWRRLKSAVNMTHLTPPTATADSIDAAHKLIFGGV